jgi:hypothetical protein
MGSAVIAIGNRRPRLGQVGRSESVGESVSVAPGRFGSTSSRPVAPLLLQLHACTVLHGALSRRVGQSPTDSRGSEVLIDIRHNLCS